MDTTVQTTALGKRFGPTVALDDVDLELAPGVNGLLGPNGAGKTTLLRILATVLAPDRGTVELLGHRPDDATGRLAIRRRLGYLPQEPGFHRHFSAFEFVDYVAILKEWGDRRARHDEVRRVLTVVGLEDQMATRIRDLSGGMRRRVGIAQSLLGRPDLLLLDRTVNLVEERIDLAVRITNDLDPNLVARRLGTCHSVVCASPAYLARHPMPHKVQDLALHNCLTYTYFGKSLWEFNGPDGPESVPVSGNLSANISNLLLEATLGGAGISLQPLYSAQPYLEQGELVPLLTNWQPKRLGIYGVYATRKQMSPLLRSFLDFLLARMAADPVWQEVSPPHSRK